jgi:hypothetical protein
MNDTEPPTTAELRSDLANATSNANARMQEACEAADKALATQSADARDRFLKQEQQALVAYENWRKASENLRQHLTAG